MLNAEATGFHTRLLRLTLVVQESRAYWEAVDPGVKGVARVERAFTERWFGNKSLGRVKLLLANFAARFDDYPEAFETLRRWQPDDAGTRPLLCHWHLQLSDPLYRAFTGEWLVDRRSEGRLSFDTDTVARWVETLPNTRWAPSTRFQFASKLIRTADEGGLVSPISGGRRTTRTPRVPDEALGYLVRVLRGVTHAGTWRNNPYLRSVGLADDGADARLRRLPGIEYRRMGELFELQATPLGALS